MSVREKLARLSVEAHAEARRLVMELTGPRRLETVAEVWEAYRDDKAGRPVATQMVYTGKPIKAHFGAMNPLDITAEDCRAYTAVRRAQGIHDGTIHTELGHLRTALVWAAKPGRRMIAEAVEIERPQKPDPKDRWLTRAEVEKLLAAATQPHIRLAIILMLSTAGRVGAILELTWDRCDFAEGVINLRKEADGPRKGRAIPPMNRTARAALLAARPGALSDHVIEWGGEPVKCILKGVKSAAARAGLKGVSPHVLRHTAAVWMASSGVPMAKIAAYLGHSNVAVTAKVYARYVPQVLGRGGEVIDIDALRDELADPECTGWTCPVCGYPNHKGCRIGFDGPWLAFRLECDECGFDASQVQENQVAKSENDPTD